MVTTILTSTEHVSRIPQLYVCVLLGGFGREQ